MSKSASINIDVLNVGTAAYEALLAFDVPVVPVNFGEGAEVFDRSGKYRLINKRAQGYWQFREPQVKLSVRFKQLATIAPGWDILPYNEEPIHQETAEFVHDTLTNLRLSMNAVLLNVLDGLVDGFSVNELVYERIKSGEWSGRIGLNRIVDKPSETFDFDSDETGNLKDKGLIQFSKSVEKRRVQLF